MKTAILRYWTRSGESIHSASGREQKAWYLVFGSIWCLQKLTDPLPTEQQKRENDAEIGPDWTVEKRENEGSTSFRQAFRIEVRLLFSTKRVWGVGIWLMDAGRGSQKRLPKMPKSPEFAKIESQNSQTQIRVSQVLLYSFLKMY
jgi:hypothetical protein